MSSRRPSPTALLVTATAALSTCAACAVGPRYVRPEMPPSAAYRESPPAGWLAAQPADAALRGDWWTVFREPGLDALESRVALSNQNVRAAEAQYQEARAAARVARADLFPELSVAPSVTRTGGKSSVRGGTLYQVPADVSYQADVWGSIRRTVAANVAGAQAAAAELENARLLYQSDLAADYFEVEGLDAERRLLEETVRSYEQGLQLTRDRFQGGVVSMADVALAETQLESARAQLTDLESTRAQFEHAIAVLTGRPPSDVSIPPGAVQTSLPAIPVGLPSTLLERRPDIAAAERRVAAANQQIGVAKAALFPALSLGGNAATQAGAAASLFTVPTRLWSLGAQLAQAVFDGGKRRAQVAVSEAAYDTTVATYRQTVLTGFQQVEDALATLRTLATEAEVVDRAIAAAQQSLDISTTQYRGGLINYLQVIDAQTSLLQNQRARVDVRTRALLATVSLIQALGGGWDASRSSAGNETVKVVPAPATLLTSMRPS